MKDSNGAIPKEDPAQPRKVSIISFKTSMTGNLIADGAIHIDGEVLGDVSAKSVTIGLTGRVDGIIQAHKVVILGTVTGGILASDVHIESTALVKGDVRHAVLSIKAGAQINGFFEYSPVAEVKPQADVKPQAEVELQVAGERTLARAASSVSRLVQSMN